MAPDPARGNPYEPPLMTPAAPDPARSPAPPSGPEPARKLVTVFGGSGFIGRYVVGALARRGWRVRVAVRQPHVAHHLQPLGTVGQIMPVQANVRYPDSLAAACSGADAVINLVAVLYNSGAQTFDAIHVHGSGAVAEAARDAGARRLGPHVGAGRRSGLAGGVRPQQGRRRSASAARDA
jgi:NAD(P)-dependent dehydrogenase (short-subunit alcohol dehydrogenase family)